MSLSCGSNSCLTLVDVYISRLSVIIIILVHFVAKLVDKLVKAVALGFVNKFLGSVFGILKVGFIISIFLFIMNKIDENINFIPEKVKQESILYQPLYDFPSYIYNDLDSLDKDKLHIDKIKDYVPN